MKLIDDDVESIVDRPPSVFFRNVDGEMKKFNFDYIVAYRNGARVAYRIAYNREVERFNVVANMNLVSKQVGRSFATALRLRTERHITRDVAENARLLFNCGTSISLHPEIIQLAVSLKGAIKIADLLAATEQFGSTFRDVLTLIRHGHLKLASKGKITRASYVCRAHGDVE
ncbi:MAG: hypothetical protein E6Q98_15015 [Rhodospirillaceae bacterium]|nr:MAG: hypothetical protein E6Q98_15015 [Rhodospirillaceae bacterium]